MSKIFLCKTCGETDPKKFPKKRKIICKFCINELAKQKRHNAGRFQKIVTQKDFINKVIQLQGDKYDFSKTIYINYRSPVIVTCKKHNHDFEVVASILTNTKHSRGRNFVVGSCPICYKEYMDSIKFKFIEKLKKIHNFEYDYDVENYVDCNTRFHAICKTHGKFLIHPTNHALGYNYGRCPECVEAESPIKIIDGHRYFNCSIHGMQKFGKHRSISSGCPVCAVEEQTRISDEKVLNRLLLSHGEKYDIVIHPHDVDFICKTHKHRETVSRSKLGGHELKLSYCSICDQEKRDSYIQKVKDTLLNEYSNFYEFREFLGETSNLKERKVLIFNKLTEKEQVVRVDSILRQSLTKNQRAVLRNHMSYEDARAKVRALGITNFREYKKWYKRTQQTDLPTNPQRSYKEWTSYCDFFGTSSKSSMSIGEKRIETYLQRKQIKFEFQKRFPDCRNKNPLPFDFYLPEYNLIVEFDGEQHYSSNSKFGEEAFQMTQRHDKIKTQYCRNKGISIIRFTYDDLTNNIIEWSMDIEISRLRSAI